jgi:hypothetical protein
MIVAHGNLLHGRSVAKSRVPKALANRIATTTVPIASMTPATAEFDISLYDI